MLGRTFFPNENRNGAETVIVLSHRLWQHNFGSRPGVLGQRLSIDGDPAIVVGVMPAGFGFPDAQTDVWIPLARDRAGSERTQRHLNVLGRVKPGVAPSQAQDEMNLIARREAEEHPDTEARWGIRVILVRDEMMKKLALGLVGILAPSVSVLLIICANLAGLLLARASTRQPELAVRAALGAGRVRLVRQLVTESLLLSLAGGALGVVVFYWGIRLVRLFLPTTVPRDVVEGLHVDLGVLAFVLLVSLLAPFAFALAPALTASKLDLIETLKGSGQRPSPGWHGHGLRDSLVGLQVTLAMILLTTVAVWGKAMLSCSVLTQDLIRAMC